MDEEYCTKNDQTVELICDHCKKEIEFLEETMITICANRRNNYHLECFDVVYKTNHFKDSLAEINKYRESR